MRFRQGVLILCAALAAALPARAAAPAGAGLNDPLSFAVGNWAGKADNGLDVYDISVSLKKNSGLFAASCSGKALSGRGFQAGFSAPAGGGVYEVTVKYGLKNGRAISFDVTATAESGTELEISSLMGGGTLKFLKDFNECRLDFRSVVTVVTATLYRRPSALPPGAGKKKGSGKNTGAGDKKPLMPPMQIVR